MDPDRYLDRIGLDAADARPPTRETLARLQSAHVRTVPFETLSVTGPPFADVDGEGVVLEVPALYEKVVERERGGFCYELNGLFGRLLAESGFDVDRVAAAVINDGDLAAVETLVAEGLLDEAVADAVGAWPTR